MTSPFFFDSYAIVELIQANQNYELYKEEPVTITLFNLAEIYWYALLRLDARIAATIYERFRSCVMDVDDETLKCPQRQRTSSGRSAWPGPPWTDPGSGPRGASAC